MTTPLRLLTSSFSLLALFTLLGAGCAGGGVLTTLLEVDPIEVSAANARQELRFRAEARTSAPVIDGLVRIVVSPEVRSMARSDQDAGGDGQVRVTVYRGPDAVEDPTPINDVVPRATEDLVEVPRPALDSCEGFCSEQFVVVFAAEGLTDEPVALPIVVEAELSYQYALPASGSDFLRLTLE